MTKPTFSVLVAKTGISKSYASEILSGKRKPSRWLAIQIFRATGWRHESITDLSDDDMAVIERLDAPSAAA